MQGILENICTTFTDVNNAIKNIRDLLTKIPDSISNGSNIIFSSSGTTSLPLAVNGQIIRVVNDTSKAVKYYPQSGQNIDILSANLPITVFPNNCIDLLSNTNSSFKMITGKSQRSQRISLPITGTNSWSTVIDETFCYLTLDTLTNKLLLEWSAFGTQSSASTTTLTIPGITTRAINNYFQPAGFAFSLPSGATGNVYTAPNGNSFYLSLSGNATSVIIKGFVDIELESQTLI